jgi:hypothetical protein
MFGRCGMNAVAGLVVRGVAPAGLVPSAKRIPTAPAVGYDVSSLAGLLEDVRVRRLLLYIISTHR